MTSMLKTLLVLSSLALVYSELIPVLFSSLDSSTTQKVVVLHDPNIETSVQTMGVLQMLDDAGTYGTEYEYVVCDVTSGENAGPVASAGFTVFPQIFTQTTEGGIEPFGGDFTVESFAAFHAFRKTDVGGDNVQRMKCSDGLGDVEGVVGMLEISAERPVLVKMYEVLFLVP